MRRSLACSLLVCACAGGGTNTPESAPAHDPTYANDVAPLLAERCVGCHQPGGPGPFSLATAEDAIPLAPTIVGAVQSGLMPPFPADDESCEPIADARRLTDDEIATLARWAELGAPRGEATAEPATPPPYGELEHVDAVLRSDEGHVPRPGEDDHRCFVLSPELAADRYLTAYAVRQDVPGVLHHVQLWAIDDDASDAMLDTLDAADEGAGYACPYGHGVPARYVSVWAPSDPVRRHPAGTGVLLRAGRRMVIQMHYHHDDRGSGLPDRTAVELQLEPSVERAASMLVVSNGAIVLPPGMTGLRVGAVHLLGAPLALWGARSHMHETGASSRLSVVQGERERCVLDIPRWDPDWQLMYFYEDPVALAAGDLLRVDCTYDTRGRVADTRYGIGTQDEMCFGFFYVTEP